MDDTPRPAPGLGNAGTPEERRSGIGGSEAAAALGLSPWQSPYELWEQKAGIAPPVVQNEPMYWGAVLEEVIRREYVRRTGVEVLPVKEMVRHPAHPFMFAHVDGALPGFRRILEVKTARDARGWGEPGTDEIPLHYLIQVNHYLAVTAADLCDVAVLLGGQDFRIYQVERDREIEQQLIEGEARFWENVTQGIPPAATTLQDAVRRWGHLDAKGYAVAGEAELEAVRVLRDIHRQQKELEELEEANKRALVEVLAHRDHLVSPDGEILCTWKLDRGRKAYSVAERAPSRQFRVKYEDAA